MGGTQGLADLLGADLVELGHEVDVCAGRDVSDVKPYGAVVVGGALYYFVSWHKDARGLVKRHLTDLRSVRFGCSAAGHSGTTSEPAAVAVESTPTMSTT